MPDQLPEQLKVFILGPARSGTSITFMAMKKVFGLPGFGESHVMPLFNQIEGVYKTYADKFAGRKEMAGRLQPDSFARVLDEHVRAFYAEHFPAGSFVDKTPGPVVGVKLIQRVFPQARILVTKRTGVEVVNSHRVKFAMKFEANCKLWARSMSDILELRRESPELLASVLEVDQYDLTNTGRDTAERIAVHLGQSAKTDALARFFQEQRVQKTSTHDWEKRLTLADTDWDDQEKATFRTVCGPLMEAMGYPV